MSSDSRNEHKGDLTGTHVSRRGALGRVLSRGSAVLALGSLGSIARVSAQSGGDCGNFPCEPGGTLDFPQRRLPRPAWGHDRRMFSLGAARLAIDASRTLMQHLVLPLFGHLPFHTAGRAHLHMVLREEDTGTSLSSNAERYFQGETDALVAQLHFEAVEAAYRTVDTLAVLHGSAVNTSSGALLFVSQAGSGKSTLAAALAARAFDYLADDVCPITRAGELVPVPASHVMKQGSWPLLAAGYPELTNLPERQRMGQTVKYVRPLQSHSSASNAEGMTPRPVRAVVFSEYCPDMRESLVALTPAKTSAALLASGSLRGEGSALGLAHWLESVPTYYLSYSQVTAAETLLQSA